MAVLSKDKRLKKSLTLLDVFAIGTGTTLSGGFFLLPGLAASAAGPSMILSYMIAAVPLIPALLCAMELATAMPRAGGNYYFLERSLGSLAGTVGGIGTWLVLLLKTAFALIGMGAYIELFVPGVSIIPVAVGFALLFGFINLIGAKFSGMFQVLLVIGILSILSWFCGAGIMQVEPDNFDNFFANGWDKTLSTAGLVYMSYIGVTKVASISEEVKNPERNLPLGVFLSLGTVLVIYAIGTAVMVGVVPADRLHGSLTPAALAAEILMGRPGLILITAAAIFSFSSVANAGILSSSRYPLAMSRDHLVPTIFRKLSKKGIPTNSILVSVFMLMMMLVFIDPLGIAKLASVFQLMVFSSLCLAVIVMRESQISSYDPGYRSPFYPWLQIFGVASALFMMIEMGTVPLLFSIGLLLAASAWYYYYARKRVNRVSALFYVFERLGRRKDQELDRELRGILKEKGLRTGDPFDEVLTYAAVMDLDEELDFEQLVERVSIELGDRLGADPDQLADSFLQGTRVGATPVSHGAALPHTRLSGIKSQEMVIVRTRRGVKVEIEAEILGDYSSDDPIYAFFFLVSPEENPARHLRFLARIAEIVDDEQFMVQWMMAHSEQELRESLVREERLLTLVIDSRQATEELIDKSLKELELPEGCLVALINRNHEIVVPRGSTVLREKDHITILGEPAEIRRLARRYKKR
jgi:basic amino acid/polyamine antiporter, APA family